MVFCADMLCMTWTLLPERWPGWLGPAPRKLIRTSAAAAAAAAHLSADADIQEGVLRGLSGLLDRPACLPVFEANSDAVAHLIPLLLRAYRGVEHESWQGLVEVMLRWVGGRW